MQETKQFEVVLEVVTEMRFNVDARDEGHAADVAVKVATAATSQVKLLAGSLTEGDNPAVAHLTVSPTSGPAKTETYVCSSCSVVSPKVDFGPGWVECPVCGGAPLPVAV